MRDAPRVSSNVIGAFAACGAAPCEPPWPVCPVRARGKGRAEAPRAYAAEAAKAAACRTNTRRVLRSMILSDFLPLRVLCVRGALERQSILFHFPRLTSAFQEVRGSGGRAAGCALLASARVGTVIQYFLVICAGILSGSAQSEFLNKRPGVFSAKIRSPRIKSIV